MKTWEKAAICKPSRERSQKKQPWDFRDGPVRGARGLGVRGDGHLPGGWELAAGVPGVGLDIGRSRVPCSFWLGGSETSLDLIS